MHDTILAEKYVVCVEIGMADTEIMEGADAAADGDPVENRQRTGTQPARQRFGIHDAFGDEIAAITERASRITSSYRCRHGQAGMMQVIHQLPFGEGAGTALAAP